MGQLESLRELDIAQPTKKKKKKKIFKPWLFLLDRIPTDFGIHKL
jgi:hypothetical protein